VKLTLLPMLASAAVAAQPAPMGPPGPPDSPGPSDEGPIGPPGATEPLLSPPGMTPTIEECQQDPDDERCPPAEDADEDAGEDADDGYRMYAHGGSIYIHGRIHGCVFRGG